MDLSYALEGLRYFMIRVDRPNIGANGGRSPPKIKGIAPGAALLQGRSSTRLHQTRYRPRIYRWFPENVTIIKFYWHCQGVALTSASAEGCSILDDAHQRHADLLLAVEHIEQQ